MYMLRYAAAVSSLFVCVCVCVCLCLCHACREAIKWSDYGKDDSERVQKLKEMGVSEPGLDRSSRKTGPRMIIICVLGGVTYAEIHQAAEIERRTGCTVLIGGSEVLTPSAYLERLSMQVRHSALCSSACWSC